MSKFAIGSVWILDPSKAVHNLDKEIHKQVIAKCGKTIRILETDNDGWPTKVSSATCNMVVSINDLAGMAGSIGLLFNDRDLRDGSISPTQVSLPETNNRKEMTSQLLEVETQIEQIEARTKHDNNMLKELYESRKDLLAKLTK
ncbi:hypothetical protein NCTGTJJY_CDS0067 [Serratia phage 92A1]|nr:hypothetical protein NCTGTJJY_CDS0067 [Serratia phage 92A1]